MTPMVLAESRLPLKRINQGKVREIYAVDDDTLLLVASDRISAFDVVMAEPIPQKGAVLTQMSAYWFRTLSGTFPNHYLTADADEIIRRIPILAEHRATVTGRAMLVRRAEPIPFECVVRGYLAGSAWAEYQERGTMHGSPLPAGLRLGDKLPEPVFTPSTKAAEGHDVNIGSDDVVGMIGAELAEEARRISLEVYRRGAAWAAGRGILVADTKLELGVIDGRLSVCDELLTPDSSRFWPVESWAPGHVVPSFDKQPLRDWLQQTGWDKTPPPPALPDTVVAATRARYVAAYERLTGLAFHDWPGVRPAGGPDEREEQA